MQTDLRHTTGAEVRAAARRGDLTTPTPGLALGYVQANLVVVPRELAFDFLLFCQRNPKPCPVLDVTEPGCGEPRLVGPGADVRTDLPRYRVYEHGEPVDEPTDLGRWSRDDLVAFLATLTSPQYKEVGEREYARQLALSRATRPQRDTGRAFGPKSKQP